MSREWKPGDRFTLEFEVTGWSGELLECKTMSSARRAFPSSDMQHAKLIAPAAPETQKLDVTKPVRRIWSGNTGRIVGKTLDGKKLVFEHDLGGMCIGPESDFENIPEPKIMGRREAILMSDGSILWSDAYPGTPYLLIEHVVGHKMVEITEGDGMEES